MKPIKVAVTGAGGAIGYSLLFRIAAGDLFGPTQPVILSLIDQPSWEKTCKGIAMEISDCAFPTLHSIEVNTDLSKGFSGADVAMLVGAKPRGPGMERSDLLKGNGQIFKGVGQAINDNAKSSCRVVVVGNPCNTNALITSAWTKKINPKNITALTRLDQTRGIYQLAEKAKCSLNDIKQFCIWGNHSPTMVPDITHTLINSKPALEVVDQKWWLNDFMPKVAKRGGEILKFRGQSSQASAGNAAIEHIRQWVQGTNGDWTSMAVPSDGSYGIPEGLIFSFPVTCEKGEYKIVQGLKISKDIQTRLDKTVQELQQEQGMVASLM